MNKVLLFILILGSFRSVYAGDQYVINQTSASIVVGYAVCVMREDNSELCEAEKQFEVPARSKISSPFPSYTTRYSVGLPISYITSITSPTGRFGPVIIPTHAEWFKKCNIANPPLECRSPQVGNQFIGFDFRATGGAWILDDHGVTGFISMRHLEEGPSTTSY